MKILIWYNEKGLQPTGGPSGYLYNLNKYLINKKDSICFINSYKTNTFYKLYSSINRVIKNSIFIEKR